jgi:gamma-carbonic anhydrase
MAIRTVTDTVIPVTAPPSDLAELEARLDALRVRFPGAIWARYLGHVPTVAAEVFVAPGAALIGDVRLAEGASVWFGCVLRADLSWIGIGARSNIQDGTVIHLGDNDPVIIGEDVVVGHRAVLHGCKVGDGCLIGIQATVLDGAQIGAGSIIGAGAVVPAGTVVPPRSLVLGMPGKVVKELSEESAAFNRSLAAKYLRLQGNHRRG